MSIDALRQEAARVAAHVELRDVRLWGLHADLDAVPSEHGANLSYQFNADVNVQHNEDHRVLLVLGTYSVGLNEVPDASADDISVDDDSADHGEGHEVARIEFKLNALFEVEHQPDGPFTESELTAFGQTTGQFAVYPYARELIADVTRRMGLPPLHIGLMRLHMESRDG
jgi:hypothetical protein